MLYDEKVFINDVRVAAWITYKRMALFMFSINLPCCSSQSACCNYSFRIMKKTIMFKRLRNSWQYGRLSWGNKYLYSTLEARRQECFYTQLFMSIGLINYSPRKAAAPFLANRLVYDLLKLRFTVLWMEWNFIYIVINSLLLWSCSK